MSESNSPSPAGPSIPASSGNSDLAELKELSASLASQAYNLRIALLILSLVMLGFFVRESKYNAYLAERSQGQAAQVSKFDQSLEKQGTSIEKEIEKQGQAIQNLLGGLAEYSRAHPDYAPILAKYGITVAPTAAPAATAPPPAAPKK